MTVEEVIAQGELILENTDNEIFFGLAIFTIFIMGFAVVLDILLRSVGIISIIGCIVVVNVLLLNANTALNENDEKMTSEISEWKEQYVNPYMETLPTHTGKLDTFNLDGDTLFVTFTHEDKVYVEQVGISDIETSDDKTYYEYKILKQDLGHGINKGVKNFKLHMTREDINQLGSIRLTQ